MRITAVTKRSVQGRLLLIDIQPHKHAQPRKPLSEIRKPVKGSYRPTTTELQLRTPQHRDIAVLGRLVARGAAESCLIRRYGVYKELHQLKLRHSPLQRSQG